MAKIKFLCNAFSLNMMASLSSVIALTEITSDEAVEYAHEVESAVGHSDTANVFSSILCREVITARISVSLVKGDTILVGQYSGPRLPEGAITLPEGASIKWVVVSIL